jgi:hypothetical protein
MASIERVEQELKKAEGEPAEAKTTLEDFKKGADGQWFEVLKGRLRGEEGTQRAEWKAEKTVLEERQKSLEDRRTEWEKAVLDWGKKLREMDTQPGNDFVTRALGT